jgi:hypothetical protein
MSTALFLRQGGIIDISFCLSTGRGKFLKARLAVAVGTLRPAEPSLFFGTVFKAS